MSRTKKAVVTISLFLCICLSVIFALPTFTNALSQLGTPEFHDGNNTQCSICSQRNELFRYPDEGEGFSFEGVSYSFSGAGETTGTITVSKTVAIDYILVKAANGHKVYPVIGGVLEAGTYTVDTSGIQHGNHGISHISLYGSGAVIESSSSTDSSSSSSDSSSSSSDSSSSSSDSSSSSSDSSSSSSDSSSSSSDSSSSSGNTSESDAGSKNPDTGASDSFPIMSMASIAIAGVLAIYLCKKGR